MVAQSAIESPDCHFISVRFGNVFGSRGSVVHIFKHQIEIGGPVTITDRNVTRFFMTIEEAVHLVLKSPMVSSTGDTLILEMGNPVKIYDLAKELIKSSKKSVVPGLTEYFSRSVMPSDARTSSSTKKFPVVVLASRFKII